MLWPIWFVWEKSTMVPDTLMCISLELVSLCPKMILTLYYMGGIESTRTHRWSSLTSRMMLQMSSYFLTLFLSIFYTSHWGHFLRKIFWNFEKSEKTKFNALTAKVKKLKKSKNRYSFLISYFFNLNLNSTCF